MSTCPEYMEFATCCECKKVDCLGDCGAPINLENGSVRISRSLLETNHGEFQMTWFNLYESNCEPINPNRGLGNNFTSRNFAFKIDQPDGTVGFLWDPSRCGKASFFSPSGNDWKLNNCCVDALTETVDSWRVSPPDGTVWEFDKSSGLVKKFVSSGDTATDFTYDSNIKRITDMQRTFTEGGNTTVESRKFDYFSSGDHQDQLQYITLRRATSTTNPQWTSIRRVELVYYGSSELHGNLNDLKLIKQQVHNGVSWVDDKVEYFRYYTSDSSVGYKHGLKYALSPEGYERMSDPEGASDPTLAGYASLFYEYDAKRRVSKAAVDGGSTSYTVIYSENGDLNNYEYNDWQRKAVMTTEDDATKTVFSNHIGQDLLVDLKKGADQWISYTKYDDDGFMIEQASPSAI